MRSVIVGERPARASAGCKWRAIAAWMLAVLASAAAIGGLLSALRPGRYVGGVDRAPRRFRYGADNRRPTGELAASVGSEGGRAPQRRGKAMVRVALVDDQPITRAGLVRILSPTDGFEVVAECADGRQAAEQLPAVRPDVVVMDIRSPTLDGIAATAQLCHTGGAGRVLVLTTFGDDEVLWGAIEAGAAGLVLKNSSSEELMAAVRAVAGGGAWFDAGVAPRVLELCRRVIAPATHDAARVELLTDREHDVLRLMARGATNAEIGVRLHIAETTVKSHVGSIFTKLCVRDRAAAIVFAYDHGVISAGSTPTPTDR